MDTQSFCVTITTNHYYFCVFLRCEVVIYCCDLHLTAVCVAFDILLRVRLLVKMEGDTPPAVALYLSFSFLFSFLRARSIAS